MSYLVPLSGCLNWPSGSFGCCNNVLEIWAAHKQISLALMNVVS